MVRAPCCEKMGLKKGPWTPEEDQILVSHIHRYGHPNWRALPKLAGLLRCGKSCRLRWTNYLSPDIKRGNFSTEEEEMIISLHAMLGNRWSAIAARLPGRTDNEIKNVWHTHIKKRVEPKAPSKEKARIKSKPVIMQNSSNTMQSSFGTGTGLVSPERSYSEISYSGTESSSVRENHNRNLSKNEYMESSSQELLDIHENFWNEAFSLENNGTQMVTNSGPKCPQTFGEELSSGCFLSNDEDVDYWLKIFMEAGDILQDFPQL